MPPATDLPIPESVPEQLTQRELVDGYTYIRERDPSLAERYLAHLQGDAYTRAIRDLSTDIRSLGVRIDALATRLDTASERSDRLATRMVAAMVSVTVLAIVVLGASIGLSVSYGTTGIQAGPTESLSGATVDPPVAPSPIAPSPDVD